MKLSAAAFKVLSLLAESVSESGDSTHRHADRKVRPFDVAG